MCQLRHLCQLQVQQAPAQPSSTWLSQRRVRIDNQSRLSIHQLGSDRACVRLRRVTLASFSLADIGIRTSDNKRCRCGPSHRSLSHQPLSHNAPLSKLALRPALSVGQIFSGIFPCRWSPAGTAAVDLRREQPIENACEAIWCNR